MSDFSDRIAAQTASEREFLRHQLIQRMRPAEIDIEHQGMQFKETPISAAQHTLWLLEQLVPSTGTFSVPLAFQLVGRLDITALQQSLTEIMRRHEALHTIFPVVEGHPVQLVIKPIALEVEQIDLRDLPVDAREAEANRLINQKVREPFQVSHEPLMRAYLLQKEDQEHLLLINIHQLIFDRWSTEVFQHELSVLYTTYCQGQPSSLPESAIQYADFTIWQQQWLQTEAVQNQLARWKQHLAGVPALLELPTDHPRPRRQTFQGTQHHFTLSVSLLQDLRGLSQRTGCSLFMTLLAAFEVLLHCYTGQEDLVIGTPIAGRTHSETEHLIGFFVNTLALRADLSGNPTFRELLERVREETLNAYAHQEVPFGYLVKELQPQRDPSYLPLVQVMFVLQNTPRATLEMTGISTRPLLVDSVTADFDLTLEFTETADGLVGMLKYSTDLFENNTITRMGVHMQTLLEGIVAHPDQPISELPHEHT